MSFLFRIVADSKKEMAEWIEMLNAKIDLIEEMYESDMDSDDASE